MQGNETRAGVPPVIDFHSHILPAMDDGSRNVEMSLQMLRKSAEMGVDVMVATPHFYGHRESRKRFLIRRELSWAELNRALQGETGLPRVLLGAEVAFSSHIVQEPALDHLCLEGTSLLLLEMPFASWTEYELDGVAMLSLDQGYQVVLAHFERFLGFPGNEGMLERLLELPILLQMNGERLLRFGSGKWVNWFKRDRVILLGSDCHNLDQRPPNLGPARAKLARKADVLLLMVLDRTRERVTVTIEDDFSQVDPTLVEGETVTLLGEHAMNFVRVRRNVGDEQNTSRMRRHRAYFSAFADKAAALMEEDLGIAARLYQAAMPYMQTDLGSGTAADLLNEARGYENAGIVTLEGTHEIEEKHNTMRFFADETSVRETVLELFYLETDNETGG